MASRGLGIIDLSLVLDKQTYVHIVHSHYLVPTPPFPFPTYGRAPSFSLPVTVGSTVNNEDGLLKDVLHRCNRLLLHVWQDVAVSIHRLSYRGVAEHLLYDLWMNSFS